ncbi:hypothetical protein LCGC14_1682290 [marine sediment metagenome]|uniref:Uncharacterized protein n=1 Tax=marine sediment metagenome TaxID=412755 RepID=A0A0F9KN94_9ZZZZ
MKYFLFATPAAESVRSNVSAYLPSAGRVSPGVQ